MLTEKDYCDYETCVALKELGYKVPTSAYYMPNDKQLLFVSNPYRGGYIFDCFYSRNSFPEDVVTHDYIDAPTMSEVKKWLREEKKICVEIDCTASGYVWELCKAYHGGWFSGGTTIYVHYCEDNSINPLLNDCGKYESYEDALFEGIKEAVKLLKRSKMGRDQLYQACLEEVPEDIKERVSIEVEFSNFVELVAKMRSAMLACELADMRINYLKKTNKEVSTALLEEHAVAINKYIGLVNEVDDYLELKGY